MINKIELTKSHENKILEMFEYYFSKEIEYSVTISDNGIINYDSKKFGIHWFEFLSNILVRKVMNNSDYWINRYLVLCIQYYKSFEHPIDFVYNKFIKSINKESLFDNREEIVKVDNSSSKKNKDIKTQLLGVNSKDVISSSPILIKENLKKTIVKNTEDFFK